MDMQAVITTLGGSPITVEDIVVHLKTSGSFRNAVHQVIEIEVIRARCEGFDVQLDEDEVDAYAEERRNQLGLDDAIKMNDYCRWLGITFDQWNEGIENDLLRIKLAHHVILDEAIDRYYEEHRDDLKTVSVSRIVCHTEGDIRAARDAIADQGRDFSTVARELSAEDGTRLSGGYIGSVQIGMLSGEVDEAVFSAAGGDLLGPFAENGYWTLYRIEDVAHAELDEDLRQRISEHLFAEWLEAEVLRAEA